jgi:hypothetical protein
LHLIGYDDGPTLEIVLSRVRYIAQQMQLQHQAEVKAGQANGKAAPVTRLVALATSLANAKDIGEWMGATPGSLFNFHPHVRPVPLEIHIHGMLHALSGLFIYSYFNFIYIYIYFLVFFHSFLIFLIFHFSFFFFIRYILFFFFFFLLVRLPCSISFPVSCSHV